MNEIIRDIKKKHADHTLQVKTLETSIRSSRQVISKAQEDIDELKKKLVQCEEAITALEKL